MMKKRKCKAHYNNLVTRAFICRFGHFLRAIPKHLKILALIQHFEPVGLATSGCKKAFPRKPFPPTRHPVIALLKLEPDVFTRVFTPFRPTLITKTNALDEPLFKILK